MTAAAQLRVEVDPLPPPPPPPAGDGHAGETAPPPIAAAAEWTPADVAQLASYVKLPYAVVALRADASYFALNDDEASAIATQASGWMPVEWVREAKNRSPLFAGVMTIITVVAVTAPRVQRLTKEMEARRGTAAATSDVRSSEDGGRPAGDSGSAPNGDRPAGDAHGEGDGAGHSFFDLRDVSRPGRPAGR